MGEEAPNRLSLGGKLHLVVEILLAYARVRWVMRHRELNETVAWLRAAPVEAQAPSRMGRFQLAGAVQRVLSGLPTDSRCLVRSLVLLLLLVRRGVAGTLVVGVRTEPEFAAHAWVELEGEALLPGGAEYSRMVEI